MSIMCFVPNIETHKENFNFGEYILNEIMVSSGILICIYLGIIVCAIYRRCKTTKPVRSPPPEEKVEMGEIKEIGEMEEMGKMEEIGEMEEIEEKEPKRRQYNQEEP
ncbi:hypothetical protein AB205_0206520 [Aquarana catesbeiana]|uniref:Uncharacterized protein n=1 Tax=Aquarana catesbeiana TaxID=8400 RepID=A0A2G9RVK8_AQUCT|nr:hypothetical protein AB205_0206520 [Aquarana catesbeiana]